MDLKPEGFFLTCKAFGYDYERLPFSTSKHAVIDLAHFRGKLPSDDKKESFATKSDSTYQDTSLRSSEEKPVYKNTSSRSRQGDQTDHETSLPSSKEQSAEISSSRSRSNHHLTPPGRCSGSTGTSCIKDSADRQEDTKQRRCVRVSEEESAVISSSRSRSNPHLTPPGKCSGSSGT